MRPDTTQDLNQTQIQPEDQWRMDADQPQTRSPRQDGRRTESTSQPYYSPVRPLPVESNVEWMLMTGFVSILAIVFLVVRSALPHYIRTQQAQQNTQMKSGDLQSDLLKSLVESSSETQKGFLKEMLSDWKAERIADRDVFDKLLGMAVETQKQAVQMQGETRQSIQALRELFQQINATEATRTDAMQSLIQAVEDLSHKVSQLSPENPEPIASAEPIQRPSGAGRTGAFQE